MPPNLGILTGEPSGLLVLDIDPRNGGDESLFALEKEHGALPETVQCLSGSGGWHFYFALPSGLQVPSGQFAQGLDLKAHGGLVVAPGSLHVSGQHYEWEVEHHPDDVPLAEPPQWVLKRATKPRSPFPRPAQRRRRATPEQQEEFRELWRAKGLTIDPGTEAHYLCAFHDESSPSLHIHPLNAVWFCFGCGVGGGLEDLRDRMSPQSVMSYRAITDHTDIAPGTGLPDFASWPRPALPSDRCGRIKQLVEDKFVRGRHRAQHSLCQEWDCRACGRYTKDQWREALLHCIFSGTGPLHLVLVSPDKWDNVSKRIQRDPRGMSDFVRFDFDGVGVPLGTTTQVVITTANQGLEINRDEARNIVYNVVESLPFDHLRVQTSRAWEKRHRAPRKVGNWQLVQNVDGDLGELAERARSLGLTPTPIQPLKDYQGAVWGRGWETDVPPEIRNTNKYLWLQADLMREGA